MGAQGKSPSSSNSMQRVKVYRLNDDGKWDDQGTGHVNIDYLERSEELGLIVIDEEDNDTLLVHRICSEEIYRRQEDTIISWRDPEYATELALSFQETTGCSYIWDHICGVQRNLQFNTLSNLDVGPRPATGTLDASVASQSSDDSFHGSNSEMKELPPLELSTLPLILKTVVEGGATEQIRVAELIIQDHEFFSKLLDLFRMCEDLENVDSLHMIFKLLKGIILLNRQQIFEKIFSEEFILDVIGSLEYDPEVPQVQRHRAFLKDQLVFKEAIPIKDPLALSKIHQTYRIGYVKDVILPRALDEATVNSFNAIIHANNAAVISLLKDDTSFIHELFSRMRSTSTSAESKKNLVLFLHEFCALSKSLQIVQQLRLFRDLATEGVFDIITEALQSQDRKLISTGADILILFLNQDPNLLRSFVVQQEGKTLLGLLVKGMVSDFGEDMHCQFLEIIRILLDSYTLSGSQRDTFVEVFYEKHLNKLIDVVASSCHSSSQTATNSDGSCGRAVSHTTARKPEILSNICELLCFCVIHHPYRIKCTFLMNNVIEKVLFLTRRKEKFLVVAAVRFIRAILSRNDEHLVRHVTRNNLLKPVIEAFVKNGNRYNMLHSGVLDLLEYIRKENLKALVVYIVDSFWDELVKFEHLGTIQALKVKYEQSLENCDVKCITSMGDPRRKTDERALEKEEEDYFNENSDEDSASAPFPPIANHCQQPRIANGNTANYSSSRPRSAGLVDYEDDDDDDEDYNPPPRKLDTSPDEEEAGGLLNCKRKSPARVCNKDKEPEATKKQKLDRHLSSKVIASSYSTCTQKDKPIEKVSLPFDPASQTQDSKRATDVCSKDSSPRNCSAHMNESSEVRKTNGDDPSFATPVNSPSPEMVTNNTNSEPYSVR